MAAGPDPRPEPGPDAGIAELQADIEQTRGELGATVGALSDKLDVKARARQAVADAKQNAKSRPAVPVGALLAAGAGIGLVVWLRRRR
ncbi:MULTISPECIES: DUF3618 domain-containing protein [Mycolicibacterium]|jgi:hypothetical protein|uniref:DUF3618 domain-containing protein n=1 Tax=Mycolicibacterium TaxID=1866885 RepID=UPI00055A773D|nr:MULTISPECIES: DUF3618 domain-containing protein [Mycolicibacterium]PQP42301.1 DUF3618 domain-containing protein [Mycolicibacterium austroafricanum]QZT57334.1 DUF3618 domain-containing protein [Mycolicibacterium austroafricanum]QZY46632.1 DUF3618 domain-containing protein [Mycolicibacterium austroafricanum]UJL29725.1 DUF3618 domain-containing protein [Mycolicibacterium vanbaalenii]WND57223.1 DUF3618 domain-containing protein [Mycolicibacterium vanbaalenii]